jgi:hypothetical protein
MRSIISIALAILVCVSCATPEQVLKRAPVLAGLGDAKSSAIEVCRPEGERQYLARVRCPDGTTPTYRRIGSFGSRAELPKISNKEEEAAFLRRIISRVALSPGETDYHVVDGYEVACGAITRIVYMDMYHCSQDPPSTAPSGFTLAPPT